MKMEENIMKTNLKMPFDNSFIMLKSFLPMKRGSDLYKETVSRAFHPLADNPTWDLPPFYQESSISTVGLQYYTDEIKYTGKPRYIPRSVQSNAYLYKNPTNMPAYEGYFEKEMAVELNDPYCDDFAEMKFYESQPTCFIILGKLQPVRLSKLIAEYWGCIHIDPVSLITEHLQANKLEAMYLNNILKSGKTVRNSHLIAMLEQRVRLPDVQHRGYILCGFPLLPTAPDDPLVKQQLEDIFIWDLPPDVVIYLTCPNADVVTIRQNIRYDLFDSGNEIDMGLLSIGKRIQQLYLNTKTATREEKELFEDNYYEIEAEKNKLESATERYLVTRITDTPQFINAELKMYERNILPIVEQYISEHNPQFVIKLDGRGSPNHMFLVLKEKLEVLPIQHVYQVETLSGARPELMGEGNAQGEDAQGSAPVEAQGEDERDVNDEPEESQSPYQVFDDLAMRNAPGLRFRWQWSHIGAKCPVALDQGDCVDGKPNYAVRFMNKLYFLSSEEYMNQFIMNPRKYLQVPRPVLPCKICVVGPNLSGKTTVAKFLAAIFDGKVLSWNEIKADKSRQNHLARIAEERVRLTAEVLEETKELVQNQYEEAVELQPKKLQEWREQANLILKQYINSFRPPQDSYDKIHGGDGEKTSRSTLYTEDEIENFLLLHDIPVFKDLEYAQELLERTSELMIYCPNELLDPIPEPEEINEMNPTVVQLVEEKLEQVNLVELELTAQEMGETLVEGMKQTEGFRYHDTNGAKHHGGWVIDGFPLDLEVWNFLEKENLAPDQVISLVDSDEYFTSLLQRWAKQSETSQPEKSTLNLLNLLKNLSPGFENHDLLLELQRSMYFTYSSELPKVSASTEFTSWQAEPPDVMSLTHKSPSPVASTDATSWQAVPPDVMNLSASVTSKVMEQVEPEVEQQITQDEPDSQQHSAKQSTIDAQTLFHNFTEQLQQFKTKWEDYRDQIQSNTAIIEVLIDNKSSTQILYETTLKTLSLLRKAAHEMTEQEKADEIEAQRRENEDYLLLEELSEEQETTDGKDTRRYGDTSIYCPVAFRLNRVLWPGKPDLACKFHDKIYNLSSNKARDMFLENPLEFAPFANPPKSVPPLRICIVGAVASGKSTVSKLLAKRLGLYYGDFIKSIEDHLIKTSEKVGRKHEDLQKSVLRASNEEQESLNKIRQYLVNGSQLSDKHMRQAVAPFWDKEPIKTEGFVLDGFPFRRQDVDFMKNHYIIPDVIVELEVSSETAVERGIMGYLELGNQRRELATKKQEEENHQALKLWEEKKRIRLQEVIEGLRKGRRPSNLSNVSGADKNELQEPKKKVFGPSEKTAEGKRLQQAQEAERRKSQEEEQRLMEEDEARRLSIISQLNEQEANDWILSEANEIIAEEFPYPPTNELIQQPQYETIEILRMEMEEWFLKDREDLNEIKALLVDENIPWVTVDAENDIESIVNSITYKIDRFKNRKRSAILERVYDVKQKEAEDYIHYGHYFLSKFGRWCPVQLYKKENPIQMFIPLATKDKCIPVIHRKFIYFLANQENRRLFGEDPLHYIKQDPYIPIIPLRISIIGPPKCGKTTLAERLSNELGVRVVSIGSAIRHVMYIIPRSELAQKIQMHKDGSRIPDTLQLEAVESEMLANKSLVQGVIFDGFPLTTEQILSLSMIGCAPTLTIHLDADSSFTIDGLQSLQSQGYSSRNPVHPEKMVIEKYNNWEIIHKPVVDFVKHEYQNVVDIPANRCKWWVYKHCLKEILKNMRDIKHYLQFVNDTDPISLEAMSISSQEFTLRQSEFRHYCPVCLKNSILITSGFPPKCQGLIQYKMTYYWVCPEHYQTFMKDAELYVPPANHGQLPENLPKLMGEQDKIECDSFIMDGLCVVHYHDSPGWVVRRETGLWYLMVEYDGKVFHFCDPACQERFMREPDKYANVTIQYRDQPQSLGPVSQLPNLGYMEQTLARPLIEACLAVDTVRPKYPNLDLAQSGAIYVGTYLKTINSKLAQETIEGYQKCLKRLQDQTNKKPNIAKEGQLQLNPYITLFQPGCLSKLRNPQVDSSVSSLANGDDGDGVH